MEEPKGGGNCFDQNGNYFMSHAEEGWSLVHGIVINSLDQEPMNHCWIEVEFEQENSGGQKWPQHDVIDKSNGNDVRMAQPIYYHFGKVQDTVKYNKEEYLAKLMDIKTWGPWDIDCGR